MKIELLNHPNEKLAEIAIKMCRGKKRVSLSESVNEDLIRRVVDSGHESVAEHVNFTFRITGLSRVTSHQFVRHRIASYSQESQRYSDPLEVKDKYWAVIPDSIQENPEAKKLAIDFLEESIRVRKKMDELGIMLEDSRYFLPNATKTAMIVTMNARTLWNFFNFRICSRAQWEIRRLAKLMYYLVNDVAPALFSWWTPRCERGCPEKCGDPVSNEIEEGTIITGKTIEYLPKDKRD
ncbi:MAG: FAD-dependent thymidylate synthase [Candidatus Heimdallarchaeota archaeon]|nr:FAD-dependent thymidylate synthase [Candidatus Heimdallarchaeota archaeon]MCG3252754.1 FAD-dependent thymidylate synthase [Candidatus Heimdallarchaeota archaeon]MCK4289891.1 FAD-dependent thymidylate synthase [Candidatus Heimdallarchaeota archaeon]